MEVKFKNALNVPTLGDKRRVPSYAYRNWGLKEGMWRTESEKLYESEWAAGSPKQMQYVVDAITNSGLGNFSQMLRDINADAVTHIVNRAKSVVKYFEPGAGVSTVNVYQKLKEKNIDLEKIYTTMLEPSKTRVEAAAEELKKMGLKEDKNFKVVVDKDTNALNYVQPRSQDLVSCVAQIHHHSYLDTPLRVLYNSLCDGGIIMIADWHNSLWEHPARVYQALKEDYEWPTKKEDLKAFLKAHPFIAELLPDLSKEDLEANRMIREFWKSYGKIKAEAISKGEFNENDELIMLEAHRPIERQVEEMESVDVGFSMNGKKIEELKKSLKLNVNPHQLLPTSRILMFTVGIKEYSL
jgi:SAM-dependent methyltransferase